MLLEFDGALPPGVTAKDMILGAIGHIGVDGGVGSRRRVRRRGDPRALDGGADDDLQHDDRGGRAGGHDRARRDDVRVPRGARSTRRGRGVGARARRLADARARTRARSTTRTSWSTSPSSSRRSPGARTRAWSHRSTASSRTRRHRRPRRPRRRRAGARVHGPPAGPARSTRSRSTASSSARARTRGSRTCAPRRRSSPADGSTRA